MIKNEKETEKLIDSVRKHFRGKVSKSVPIRAPAIIPEKSKSPARFENNKREGEKKEFNAFISYHWTDNLKHVELIKEQLQKFAKPWYKLRGLQIFLDKTNMAANPGILSDLEERLIESEFFILLASPGAAGSEWIKKEIEIWFRENSADNIILVLTDGEIVWDEDSGDFNWEKTNALPGIFSGVYQQEPFYIDLRWIKEEKEISIKGDNFRNALAGIAAPLHGVSKDEIFGKDLQERRKTKQTIAATVLTIVSLFGFWGKTHIEGKTTERISLVESFSQRGISSFDNQNAASRLNFSQAVIIAMPKRFIDDFGVQIDDFVAKSWLSQGWGKSVPQIFWHKKEVYSVGFSPDGKLAITGSGDKTARLWNVSTGLPYGKTLEHKDTISQAVFSSDGTLIATTSSDKTAKVWDAKTFQSIGIPLKHRTYVKSAAFNSTGNQLATVEASPYVYLWDLKTFERISLEHFDDVNSVMFSKDGSKVLTASQDGAARLWNAKTGIEIRQFLHEGPVVYATFSPDGNKIATASDDQTAILWNADTGKPIGKPMEHDDEVVFVAFSPQGDRLVTAGWDNTAKLWDANSLQQIGPSMKHSGFVNQAKFSPDGRMVVTIGDDHAVRFWDGYTATPMGLPLEHGGPVQSFAFSPDGNSILSGSFDNTARLWSMPRYPILLRGHKSGYRVQFVKFDSNGNRIISGGNNGRSMVWDAKTGEILEILEHPRGLGSAVFVQDEKIVTHAFGEAFIWDNNGKQIGKVPSNKDENEQRSALSSDGTKFVSYIAKTSDNNEFIYLMRLWDIVSSSEPVAKENNLSGPINSLRFNADSSLLITASQYETVQVWDTDLQIHSTLLHPKEEWIDEAIFNPIKSSNIAAVRTAKRIYLWDFKKQKIIKKLTPLGEKVSLIKFSPDGRYLLSASDATDLSSKTITQVWETDTGKQLGESITHEGEVHFAVFSPKGNRVLIASGNTAQIWRSQSGQKIGPILKHGAGVFSADFSPDGEWLVTGSWDGLARLWPIPIESASAEVVKLRSEVATGFLLQEDLSVRMLSELEWKDRRAALSQLEDGE